MQTRGSKSKSAEIWGFGGAETAPIRAPYRSRVVFRSAGGDLAPISAAFIHDFQDLSTFLHVILDAAEEAEIVRKKAIDKTKLLMERGSLRNHVTGWFQT